MSIVVTGAAGFIGSALVRTLIAAGEHVVSLDKLTYAGNLKNLDPVRSSAKHRFVHADINDTAVLLDLFAEERPETIYHLAAETHVDRSIDGPMAFVQTNVAGTVALLHAALGYWRGLTGQMKDQFRFLHISTDEVYGALDDSGFFLEESPYRPNSPYSASKAAADHMVRAWYKTYGLPTIVTNCANNYGPYHFPEKLIPLMILNALEGKKLPVYGKGDQIRDWLHVDDHVEALRLVASRGRVGETYLVGGHNEWRNIDLVKMLCAELDKQHPAGAPHDRLIDFVKDRPGHDARYAIDPKKIQNELGWRPHIPFAKGLAETVAWYMQNREWCNDVTERYHRERLGLVNT